MRDEGFNLKIALWVRRISQEELSERTGLNKGLISLAATGKYLLQEDQKAKIAAALQSTPEEIFESNRHHA